MKLVTMILLSVFLSKGCESQTQNDLKTAVVAYTATTRGFYQKITIQDQMVLVSKDRSGQLTPEAAKISNQDWAQLVAYFKSIPLDSLESLKAPSNKRFHDGAAIAHLEVTYKDKKYKTNPFDHGYPPEAIKQLVEKINTFAQKE